MPISHHETTRKSPQKNSIVTQYLECHHNPTKKKKKKRKQETQKLNNLPRHPKNFTKNLDGFATTGLRDGLVPAARLRQDMQRRFTWAKKDENLMFWAAKSSYITRPSHKDHPKYVHSGKYWGMKENSGIRIFYEYIRKNTSCTARAGPNPPTSPTSRPTLL